MEKKRYSLQELIDYWSKELELAETRLEYWASKHLKAKERLARYTSPDYQDWSERVTDAVSEYTKKKGP